MPLNKTAKLRIIVRFKQISAPTHITAYSYYLHLPYRILSPLGLFYTEYHRLNENRQNIFDRIELLNTLSRNFKFSTHNKSHPMDDKISRKGRDEGIQGPNFYIL